MNCKICDKSFTGLVSFQQHEASEKHKKKVKLYQCTAANSVSHETSTDNKDLLIIPCTVCEIQFTGMLNFQAHVNSLQHADMIKKKNAGNIDSKDQAEYTSNKLEIIEANNPINPDSNISFNFPNSALGFYAQCEVCQKQFSGPVPYEQHLVSEVHKKKLIQKRLSVDLENQSKDDFNEPAIAEATNEVNPGPNISFNLPNGLLGSYAQCEACQKQFSGPAPYEQHLASELHKKKSIQKGLSIVPENQSKSSSNEPVVAEAKNEMKPSPTISCYLPNGALGSYAQCEVCQKQFSGPAPYEQHLASEIHKKKVVQKKLISNKLSFDTVDSDKIMPFTIPPKNVSNNDTHPFAECKSCNMKFSGSEPYQLHLDSAGHQKKIAVEQNSSIQVPENTNCVPSSWKCSICDKDFTGPVPFNEHLDSKGHKKKLQNIEFLKNLKSSLSPEPDSSTSAPDHSITPDVKINAKSSGINNEWYCEVCKKQMTGPEPYRQHMFGELHLKNTRVAEGIRNLEKFKESFADTNNFQNEFHKDNEFSKDFHISNDLILCDTLKNIGVVRPEDLNITVFYPDDEIVFDNTIKKNNYDHKFISELNYE